MAEKMKCPKCGSEIGWRFLPFESLWWCSECGHTKEVKDGII
jgi:ribosomal protein L37AE/L43A